MALRVLLSGSAGLVGTATAGRLRAAGGEIIALVRRAPGKGEISWDPAAGRLRAADIEGFDAVVHLAGENVGRGRWSEEKKRRIRQSRVAGTELLCRALARLDRPPRVLVSASALGYYGDRGQQWLSEESPAGEGFLASLCRDWEEATRPAIGCGIRVVRLRIGVVLSPRGGALASLLPAFRLGMGGAVGGGRQYLSWIALDDVAGAISHAIATEALSGAVNAVSPNPVSNREFARALGRALRRPAFVPLPARAARLAFGAEKAQELLLSGARIRPARLIETGYEFAYPELPGALAHLLGRE